jgi:hypothetical protein
VPAETAYVEFQRTSQGNRMSARSPTRPAPLAKPVQEGSAAPAGRDKRGSLRWVREVLSRSIRLEQGRGPAPVPANPGHAKEAGTPPALLVQQRAELGARLLVHNPATQIVRNLFVVHDELRTRGWAGVEALPMKIVNRALTEAEILGSDEPSPMFTTIIENLRQLKNAADERAAQEALEREWATMQVPEVSDTNFDEYELMERSWAGTVPAGLDIPRNTI